MIRTHEELDAIINEGVEINNKRGTVTMEEWQFNAIIATARAAIPRPIGEAPRDGTKIVGKEAGSWHVCWRVGEGTGYAQWIDVHGFDRDLEEFIPIPTPEAARC